MLKAIRLQACVFLCVAFSHANAAQNEAPTGAHYLRADESEKIVLIAHPGTDPVDIEIQRMQAALKRSERPADSLERMGWLFVSKARSSCDPGYYILAERCAALLEQRAAGSLEALLLSGHVQLSLHRFKEAEAAAEVLTKRRGLASDFGLLGDALMDQGKLEAAAAAYQKMADLKPGLQVYSRAAHMAWLRGDAETALEFMHMAVASGGDAEALAWTHARLAAYSFQLRQFDKTRLAIESALKLQKDYPSALLMQGRLLLAQNNTDLAVDVLTRAATLNPLPEYQWLLADALRSAGNTEAAARVERQLKQRGASSDGRTYALFLATRKENPELALRLARTELESRFDVFTYDALAWSLHVSGSAEAGIEMEKALTEGTRDPRLFLHAGIITARAGKSKESARWFEKAVELEHMLYPSERALLLEHSSQFPKK